MKNVIKILVMVALSFSWSHPVFAQEGPAPEVREAPKNTVYFELLGNAYLYSLNYERTLLSFPKYSLSGRIGVSSFGTGNAEVGGINLDFKFRYFPLTINFIRHFNSKNNFEAGIGLANEFSNDETDRYVYLFIPTLHTGYRRFMKNNFDFRAGINWTRADLDQDEGYEVLPWPYISFGKRF